MRFWLWLTTSMVTKEWVAVHRKHHAFSDKEGDPHTPLIYGIKRVLFGGALLYNDAANDKKMVEQFGVGTPDDWVERNVYTKFKNLGILLLLLANIAIFSWWGILIWGIQMLWIPFWAAGVINGVAHYVGYRNYDTKENSHNILPWGILIGGEELHNNHHQFPASAKFERTSMEFDVGWFWIEALETVGLATVKKPSEKG
jgi:stearoyl-CoA desaturase (delta-9 desaturase)